TSPLRAVSLGPQLPRTLRGERAAISVSGSQSFQIGGDDTASVLEAMYAASLDKRQAATARDAFAARRMIESVNQQPYDFASNNLYYQGGELGRNLQQLARMIKANVGVEAGFAEVGGWDHHGNEAPLLDNLLR